VALLTKWSAAVYLVPIVAAAIVSSGRDQALDSRRRRASQTIAFAAPLLAIAAPWYLSTPGRLFRRLAEESLSKGDGVSLRAYASGLLDYVADLGTELFWLPVLMGLFVVVRSGWKAAAVSTRRFWIVACAGSFLILSLVPHRQSRFAAPLAALLILAIADLVRRTSLPRLPALLLLAAAATSGLGISIPSGSDAPRHSRLSPARGVPSLALGPPRYENWPHRAILGAASRAGLPRRRSVGNDRSPSAPVRVALEVDKGHRYLNFWTFQSVAVGTEVRMIRNPSNADVVVVAGTDSALAAPGRPWFRTPDGWYCRVDTATR
jgi:hypothetical protein